jgi:hypothetical protein
MLGCSRCKLEESQGPELAVPAAGSQLRRQKTAAGGERLGRQHPASIAMSRPERLAEVMRPVLRSIAHSGSRTMSCRSWAGSAGQRQRESEDRTLARSRLHCQVAAMSPAQAPRHVQALGLAAVLRAPMRELLEDPARSSGGMRGTHRPSGPLVNAALPVPAGTIGPEQGGVAAADGQVLGVATIDADLELPERVVPGWWTTIPPGMRTQATPLRVGGSPSRPMRRRSCGPSRPSPAPIHSYGQLVAAPFP